MGGIFGIAAGYFDWGYQYRSPGQRLIVDLLGRTGTRILSIVGGIIMVIFGILMLFNLV